MDTRTARLLDLYTDYLLASFGQATATGLAALRPDLSHDQVTRFLSQQELTDKDLWKIVKPHLRHVQCEEAVLILDDTVTTRWKKSPIPTNQNWLIGISIMSPTALSRESTCCQPFT